MRILGRGYQPIQLYIRAGPSFPAHAPFFLICLGYSTAAGYCPCDMPRPDLDIALSLELAFSLYLKYIYQTSVFCLLRLQVVLQNDLPYFIRANFHSSAFKLMSSHKKITLVSIQFHIVILKPCYY